MPVVLLAGAGLFALIARRPRSRQQSSSDPPQNHVESHGTADHRLPPATPKHSSSAPSPEVGRQRTHPGDQAHSDGRGWTRSEVIGAISAGATLAGSLFAALALIAALQAVGQASRQADIAQNALTASSRPWVMLAEVKPERLASDDEAGVIFWVNISVKNVGHSPAQNVSVSGELLIGDYDPSPDQAMANVCQRPRRGSFIIPGRVLFPDQTQSIQGEIPNAFSIRGKKVWAARAAHIKSSHDYEMAREKPERAQALAEALSKFPFHAPLSLVGCINYRSPDNATLYQTSFMFDVGPKPDGTSPPYPVTFPLLGGVPPVTRYPEPKPDDPDILMVFPRELQRVVSGDRIKLGSTLYSTFAD